MLDYASVGEHPRMNIALEPEEDLRLLEHQGNHRTFARLGEVGLGIQPRRGVNIVELGIRIPDLQLLASLQPKDVGLEQATDLVEQHGFRRHCEVAAQPLADVNENVRQLSGGIDDVMPGCDTLGIKLPATRTEVDKHLRLRHTEKRGDSDELRAVCRLGQELKSVGAGAGTGQDSYTRDDVKTVRAGTRRLERLLIVKSFRACWRRRSHGSGETYLVGQRPANRRCRRGGCDFPIRRLVYRSANPRQR